ncbi:phosphotransferase family protein [Sorangium sp. So ce1335]|uniref:phosphotransferase family protein n=1 Tax=Sorangium sp. So ce1335 TaxID=3133335 RepID=UPI003F6225EE
MSLEDDAPLLLVMSHLGLDQGALIGVGGEACVFALGKDRIARVHHPGATRETVARRARLLDDLHRSAGAVPFSIPRVLELTEAHGRLITIEPRLPGRSLLHVLGEAKGAGRDRLLMGFLEVSTRLCALRLDHAWYGDLCDAEPIRASSHRAYLEQRAGKSLACAGSAFAGVDPARLAAALPEPDRPSFVHLDLFPGNVLVEGEEVSAVVDFGGPCILGDARLEPLSAVCYLTPYITSTATVRDRRLAREWLKAQGLDALFEPAERWLAARWSFARDDVSLHRWCQHVLLDPAAPP